MRILAPQKEESEMNLRRNLLVRTEKPPFMEPAITATPTVIPFHITIFLFHAGDHFSQQLTENRSQQGTHSREEPLFHELYPATGMLTLLIP